MMDRRVKLGSQIPLPQMQSRFHPLLVRVPPRCAAPVNLGVRCKTMSFQKDVDEKIREAIGRGEFDNLPGKGKPLDLDAYFAAPEHLRMGYSILKSADIIPEELELLRQIEILTKSLDSSTTGIEKRGRRQQLSEKLTNFNMRM